MYTYWKPNPQQNDGSGHKGGAVCYLFTTMWYHHLCELTNIYYKRIFVSSTKGVEVQHSQNIIYTDGVSYLFYCYIIMYLIWHHIYPGWCTHILLVFNPYIIQGNLTGTGAIMLLQVKQTTTSVLYILNGIESYCYKRCNIERIGLYLFVQTLI